MRSKAAYLPFGILFLIGLFSCSSFRFRSNYRDVNELLHKTESLSSTPFLKAHLKNGDVCILTDRWVVDQSSHTLTGLGERYDFNRNSTYRGPLSIPVDSVAIFETNAKIEKPEEGRVRALAILAGVDLLVGVFCMSNPKACYGSCPTFYVDEKDNLFYADAEGFSSAIAPSLEYGDIDALNARHLAGHQFSITMKNEALETHCIKEVKLLAYPIREGERVYQSNADDFLLCKGNYPLSDASASEGDITPLLKSPDRKERFSLADAKNIKSREEIILRFENLSPDDSLGLVVNFRQTLMTTFFIYSAMGYMGNAVGDVFSKLERTETFHNKLKEGIKKELGDLEVFVWDEDRHQWLRQGGFYEVGPIAINRQLMPLLSRAKNSEMRIKLVLNKGLWRLDYAALTRIEKVIAPEVIMPFSVLNKGKEDPAALADIMSSGNRIISMPGSEYKFNFILPDSSSDYDLFLYSKGYYLEWMRQHWIKDKDLSKLNQMLNAPGRYLKREASNYKEYEKTMEMNFWNSRIDTKSFSYEK